MGFPSGSVVKNPPADAGMQVACLSQKIPWRRKCQCTPGLLSGKSHGQRSLVVYSPWGPQKTVGHDLDSKQQQQSLYTYISFPSICVYNAYIYINIHIYKMYIYKMYININIYNVYI